jgi:hypothetical protein
LVLDDQWQAVREGWVNELLEMVVLPFSHSWIRKACIYKHPIQPNFQFTVYNLILLCFFFFVLWVISFYSIQKSRPFISNVISLKSYIFLVLAESESLTVRQFKFRFFKILIVLSRQGQNCAHHVFLQLHMHLKPQTQEQTLVPSVDRILHHHQTILQLTYYMFLPTHFHGLFVNF